MLNKKELLLKFIDKLKSHDTLIISTKDMSLETLNCIHDTFQYDYIYDPVEKMRIKITDLKEVK